MSIAYMIVDMLSWANNKESLYMSWFHGVKLYHSVSLCKISLHKYIPCNQDEFMPVLMFATRIILIVVEWMR